MADTDVRTENARARSTVAAGEPERDRTEHGCSECEGTLVSDTARGETRCRECGLVVADGEIDHGPEWRAFDTAERHEKSRVGAPTTHTIHDRGLSTTISWRDQDAHGRALSGRQRRRMNRLRTWDERYRMRDAKERNLKQALGEIDRMASALGLPGTVRETASVLYRRALDDGLLPGRSIEGVATAALYAAARQADAPRSIDEVAAVSRVDATEFKRTYRYVVRELDLEMRPTNPVSYLPRFVSQLGASTEAERRARSLLETAEEHGITSGRSPVSIAAAAVYAAGLLTGAGLTQKEVSAVTNTSEVTIRNRYRELVAAERSEDPTVTTSHGNDSR